MRPQDHELDDEIRGHLAISIKERIDRGEDPEAARLAALREFGYVPKMRDEMRRVWYSRWFDATAALVVEMRVGLRSLLRAKGLAATVVVTLALGIGANAAIFSVVRGVMLRPLPYSDPGRVGVVATRDLAAQRSGLRIRVAVDVARRSSDRLDHRRMWRERRLVRGELDDV